MHSPEWSERNRLIESHQYMAAITARRYSETENGVDFADVEGAALYGLCRAADTYDPAKGCTFRTWAIRKMQAQILELFREMDPYPRLMREQARREQITLPGTLYLQDVFIDGVCP